MGDDDDDDDDDDGSSGDDDDDGDDDKKSKKSATKGTENSGDTGTTNKARCRQKCTKDGLTGDDLYNCNSKCDEASATKGTEKSATEKAATEKSATKKSSDDAPPTSVAVRRMMR